MSLCDWLHEEESAAARWRLHLVRLMWLALEGGRVTVRQGPRKGDRLRLRGLTYVVTREEPLTVKGPSGRVRRVPAETLARMEAERG